MPDIFILPEKKTRTASGKIIITDGPIPEAMSAQNPSGHILVDGQQVADTIQCSHCACHWIHVRGSGRKRGWCLNCSGPTCGSEACDLCVPYEASLESIEKGR